MPPPPCFATSIGMVGDSISSLVQPTLQPLLGLTGFTSVTINAQFGRRIQDGSVIPMTGIDVATFINAAKHPQMWVIALGTNDVGQYAEDADYQTLIDHMIGAVSTTVPLVWVNIYHRAHLDACDVFNAQLRTSLESRGNAMIADWHQQCVANAANILNPDGVHPNDAGILVFADTVRDAVMAACPR